MSFYIRLAKEAIRQFIKEGKTINPPADSPKEIISQRAGVFVSICNGEDLRGCIGTYLPNKKNIAEEIIANSIAAATEDYRFSPITLKELPDLSYLVYVLNEPQQIENISELDPKKYGILIKSETGRSGLLLPDLPGIDSAEAQLSTVAKKCGADLQKEKITIWKFRAKKYEK